MQRRIISAVGPSEAERFEWWRTVSDQVGVAADVPRGTTSYQAKIAMAAAGPLTHIAFEIDPHPVYRPRHEIRRVDWDQYWLYRELGEGAWFDFGGREVQTGPGDLIIADTSAPFRTQAKQAYRHHMWMLPRVALDPHLPPLPRPLVVHLSAHSGVDAVVVAYIDSLAAQFENLTGPLGAMIADNLGRLIAIACGAAAGAHKEALRTAKLAQARRYIDQHLASPELNPEKAAGALGISLRQLHLAFEPSGESFGQYVRRRRLQECRSTLENPLADGRSITDVAFAWGFSSLPSFYRAFNRAYGAAPGDLRAQAEAVRRTCEAAAP